MKICDYGRHTIIVDSTGQNIEIYNDFLAHAQWIGKPYDRMFIFFMFNGYILDDFTYKVAYDHEKIREIVYPNTYIRSTLQMKGIFSGEYLSFEKRAELLKQWDLK